ncbi:MAG TPA: sugar phosphate isomerase/epimerase, partial [Candidatus Paceibacterota bacterium]|nr:sugar phosphate isomerase/epimerase [Candidatus Paceibacterota bacterium]
TAAANVDGEGFACVDVICDGRHGLGLGTSDDDIKRFADKVLERGLSITTVVAPVWPGAGGGSAMGDNVAQQKFLDAVRFACHVGDIFKKKGARQWGNIRVDSAEFGIAEWRKDTAANTARIVETFQLATQLAMGSGERLAAEMEVCWAGMHSVPRMVEVLEKVGQPKGFGLMADLAHVYTAMLGYNAPEDAMLPLDRDYTEPEFWAAYEKVAGQLRDWTIDFHVAQNDGTVHGAGDHDKTGKHCQADDPNGRLDIVKCAGYWLTDAGKRGIRHICWDGCMFPNAVLEKQQTWNTVLKKMLEVRDAHGWD